MKELIPDQNVYFRKTIQNKIYKNVHKYFGSNILVFKENGLNCLLDLLAGMDWDTAQSSIHTAALGCMKALMNNTVSLMEKC